MKTPFTYGKIAVLGNFTNREKEQKRLSDNIQSVTNTTLISPRRWGKSSLVYKVAEELKQSNKKIHFCFIDLFKVRTEEEFYNLFANELLQASSSKWEERIETGKKLFKSIIPRFSLGIDPAHDLSVSFNWEEVKRAPEEILNLPEKISLEKNIQIVVCIDEFQQIGFFDDPLSFQKKLRAHWQHHQEAAYCLYGSKRHMMMELFEKPSMPFYKFGDVIFLEKIEEKYWISFIKGHFKRTNKKISTEQAARIAQKMENHPYFVQQLAQQVWRTCLNNCSDETITDSIAELMLQQTILFQKETDNLTNSQLNFLKALCDNVEQLSAALTLQNYNLGTSANVNRIKEALESKEVIDITGKKIDFIDPLYKNWLKQVYFR